MLHLSPMFPFRARRYWQNAATRFSGAFAKNKAEEVLSAAKKKSFDKKNEALDGDDDDDQRIHSFGSRGKKKRKRKVRERDLLLLFSEDLADGNWRSWQRALRQKERS